MGSSGETPGPAAGGDHDLVIVSDLHLGPGSGDGSGCWPLGYRETFFRDAPFCRLLEDLGRTNPSRARPWRLVILGDFVDFLRAGLHAPEETSDQCQVRAGEALELIAEGHPQVFEGLGRWLAEGHPLDIVVGNHDRELAFPSLQDRMRRLLERAGAGGAGAGLVTFHPWIYYVPGLVYAEHGHQYDDLNCFSTQLWPCGGPRGDVVEQPVGSRLYQATLDLLDATDPCPDHASPPLRYYRLAARHHPAAAMAAAGGQLSLVAGVVGHARRLSGPGRRARRRAYHDALGRLGAGIGLSPDVLVALDDLSSASGSPLALLGRRAAHQVRLKAMPAAGLLAGMSILASRSGPRGWARALAAAGTVAITRSPEAGPTGRKTSYLPSAAARIHRLLTSVGHQVPCYVFGHNHAAQHLPLELGAGAAQYLNAGTWSCVVPPGSDPVRLLHPTFVRIERRPGGGPPVSRVLAWDAQAGSAQTLRFQA